MIASPIATVRAEPGESVTIDLARGARDPDGGTVTLAGDPAADHGTVDRVAVRVAAGGGRTGGATAVLLRPMGGTVIRYTPDAGWRGTDTVRYTLVDDHGDTVDGAVRVLTPNAEPDAAADAETVPWHTFDGHLGPHADLDVLANDDDPNADPLQVTIERGPQHGTVTVEDDGTITYDGSLVPGGRLHVHGYRDSFVYRVTDGHGGTDTATVTLTVEGLDVDGPPGHAPASR